MCFLEIHKFNFQNENNYHLRVKYVRSKGVPDVFLDYQNIVIPTHNTKTPNLRSFFCSIIYL
jgi:hypothetical protein